MRIKRDAPRCTSIGKKNVDVVGMTSDFGDQSVNVASLCKVRRRSDSFAAYTREIF